MYYLQSRYYDSEVGRFISADSYAVTYEAPTGANMFAYCGNNPIKREDPDGDFWETAIDVISLGASIVNVAVNPTDPIAWITLAGDAVDLLPFVTGVGEVTRAVTVTVKATENSQDLVKTARKIYNTSDKASGIRSMTGSYEIVYESGKTYVGKGGFYRATTSAKRNTLDGDVVKSITWTSAQNSIEAFINEYRSMVKFGGPNGGKYKNEWTYNKIWSPGKRILGD